MAISHSRALIGKPQTDELPYVVRILRPDDGAKQRCETVWTLGLTGIAGIPAITEALRDEDVEVRCEAVWALGRIGSPAVMPALQQALQDKDPEVRGLAGDVLRAIKQTHPPGA